MIAKKSIKGFTLIELLVVVAIIGILAAVGVVAYNGYTGAAKKSAVKTIHAQTLKYIAAELQKCSLDATDVMVGDGDHKRACSGITASNVAAHIGNADNIGKVLKDKNPYTTGDFAVKQGTAAVKGQTSISGAAKTITIKSCVDAPCADNLMTGTVDVE